MIREGVVSGTPTGNVSPRVPISRWPRIGCSILPAALREAWSTEPLPPDVVSASGLHRSATYADLGDAAWDWIRDYRPLAAHVRQLVAKRLVKQPGSLADQPVLTLSWPDGVEPTQVPFVLRTRNVLKRLGRVDDLRWMLGVTARQLMAPQYSGPVTLLDFATVLEGMRSASIDGRVVTRGEALSQVDELRAEFPIDQIPCDDPRLDLPLRGDTISAALDGTGPAGALTVHDLVAAVTAVRTDLERISTMEPHEALQDLARAVLRNPHAGAVARRLGWDGQGGCTLQEAAAPAGVSWQRIAQLQHRLQDELAGRYWYLPAEPTISGGKRIRRSGAWRRSAAARGSKRHSWWAKPEGSGRSLSD